MGLFDSYFDPQTYSGGGGLIDRLLSQLGTQSQYQPNGTGFPANPMDASANLSAPQNAPPQNAPIGVGNYQMPRIGGGFQQNVQPAQVDPAQAAQPTQPPQPMQAPVQQPALPPQLQPPGNGLGDHLMAGLQNFAHGGGLIPALVGGISGLATGQRNDPRGVQEQNLRAQYQALIAAGVPQQKALLATINPEFAKTIIPQTFGPKHLTPLGNGYVADDQGKVTRAYEPEDKFKVVQTGQDGLGRQQYEVFNPADGSHVPIKSAGADTNGGGLGNMELTGREYLASIPVAQRGTVQGMVEGTLPPPSSFALQKPYWQNMIAAAKQVDPSWDAAGWSGRVAGVKDFSAGKSSEMVRSANQTLHHTGALLDSMDALNNGNYPLINRAGNAINEAAGGGAPTAFRLNAHAVAEEMSKVFKGSNLSDSEIRSWEENLTPNMSPEQQRAAIGKLRDLLQGSLQALDEKRVASMGPMAAEKAGPIIKPEGQLVLQRIDDWLKKGAAQGSAPAVDRSAIEAEMKRRGLVK